MWPQSRQPIAATSLAVGRRRKTGDRDRKNQHLHPLLHRGDCVRRRLQKAGTGSVGTAAAMGKRSARQPAGLHRTRLHGFCRHARHRRHRSHSRAARRRTRQRRKRAHHHQECQQQRRHGTKLHLPYAIANATPSAHTAASGYPFVADGKPLSWLHQQDAQTQRRQKAWFSRCDEIKPLLTMVTTTSIRCAGRRSPRNASSQRHSSPPAIRPTTSIRRCRRNPQTRAIAPISAINTASVRCIPSTEGRKRTSTADAESATGVSRQCTRQSADVHTPTLSAHGTAVFSAKEMTRVTLMYNHSH